MIRALLVATGLLTGPVQVGIVVDSPPHAVEIYLDGKQVAELSDAPWTTWVELGDELAPRRLEAVSRDASGAVVDRRSRWLNLPAFPPGDNATPIVVLLDDPKREPEGLTNAFRIDGEPAAVLSIENPDAELWIVRDPRLMDELETAASLVVAEIIRYGGASVLLDGETLRAGLDAALERLQDSPEFVKAAAAHRFAVAWNAWQTYLPVDEDTTVRMVSPWGAPVSQVETPRDIFTTTQPLDARKVGVLQNLFETRPLGRWYRMADAIGISGVEAASNHGRRAVLVLTSDTGESDLSLYDFKTIRRYLGDLGVPVHVWSFEYESGGSDSYWGPGTSRIQAPLTKTARPLWAAHQALLRTLRRQRIVWIAGHHDPARVELAPAAQGFHLVRDFDAEDAGDAIDDSHGTKGGTP